MPASPALALPGKRAKRDVTVIQSTANKFVAGQHHAIRAPVLSGTIARTGARIKSKATTERAKVTTVIAVSRCNWPTLNDGSALRYWMI
jgi:hypothetical protein